jgi:hypothetical protein
MFGSGYLKVLLMRGGTRIIVGWDPNCVNVMVMDQSPQVIHCFVEPINGDASFHCSFVYDHVYTVNRLNNLILVSGVVQTPNIPCKSFKHHHKQF